MGIYYKASKDRLRRPKYHKMRSSASHISPHIETNFFNASKNERIKALYVVLYCTSTELVVVPEPNRTITEPYRNRIELFLTRAVLERTRPYSTVLDRTYYRNLYRTFNRTEIISVIRTVISIVNRKVLRLKLSSVKVRLLQSQQLCNIILNKTFV